MKVVGQGRRQEMQLIESDETAGDPELHAVPCQFCLLEFLSLKGNVLSIEILYRKRLQPNTGAVYRKKL